MRNKLRITSYVLRIYLCTYFLNYCLLTRRPVEQGKAGCAEGNQDDGNPHEEPADEGEEGGEFEDDSTADESVQWCHVAVFGESRAEVGGDSSRANGGDGECCAKQNPADKFGGSEWKRKQNDNGNGHGN